MDHKPVNPKRRNFLLGLGAGGAGAAAALLATRAPQGLQPPLAAKPKAGAGGYTESEHVTNYYRSTRV